MSKKFVLTLASAALLAGTASAVLAHGSWAFDDPYWKQQLKHEDGRNTLGKLGFGPFAAAPSETVSDAKSESHADYTSFESAIEAEKARLNAAGFPQYNP